METGAGVCSGGWKTVVSPVYTDASIMIACNLDLRTMMDRMGHAQAPTLLNTYTHGMPENDLRASNELEKALAKQA